MLPDMAASLYASLAQPATRSDASQMSILGYSIEMAGLEQQAAQQHIKSRRRPAILSCPAAQSSAGNDSTLRYIVDPLLRSWTEALGHFFDVDEVQCRSSASGLLSNTSMRSDTKLVQET